jgi:bifunctional ADP-heptose synthase (sugar kinase/adenylyltransferase)
MILFKPDGAIHQPTLAREVYDVSGAGDTVIGTMGLMLAAGLPLPQAMRLANAAAGVVVAKLGTAICRQQELFAQ